MRDDEVSRPRDITARVTLSEELDEAEREIGRSAMRRKVVMLVVLVMLVLGAGAVLVRGLTAPT